MMQKLQVHRLVTEITNKNSASISNFYSDLLEAQVRSSDGERERKCVSEMQKLNKKSDFSPYPSRNLMERRKSLLDELKTIDNQIKRAQNSPKSYQRNKTNMSDEIETGAFERATNLISRMNRQRKQMQLRKRKKEEQVHLEVQKSIKKIQEMKQEKGKIMEEKKKEIEERISNRRKNLKMIEEYNRKSNHLIEQLQSYRVSLPNINHLKNPQEASSKGKQLLKLKKYRKSPFLQNIQQEQLKQKRQLYLKEYEKKRRREVQQGYGRKLRKSVIVNDQTFVT